MNRTANSRASISSASSTSSYHSGSTPSINGGVNAHNAYLLSTAYQLPLSCYEDLPASQFSSTSPGYDMSSDPISQNFDFADIFDFDEHSFSKALSEKAHVTTPRQKSSSHGNGNKVVATPSRNSTVQPRSRPKQQRHQQVSPELDDLPEKEAVRRFSFSHYQPVPNIIASSLDSSSRRRGNGEVPSRTSPGAARLHEMLARGR